MSAIELKNISKSYQNFTLQDINLTVPEGSIVGLIGENGAGKTTMIKTILDLVRPDSGEVLVFGHSNRDSFERAKEDIGVVFDDLSFPMGMNAKHIGKLMQKVYRNWQQNVFFDFLNRFELPQNKPINKFSRGMRMKLAIAIALSHQAKLLVLDEPTGGLDPIVRDEVVDMLYEFTRDASCSVLISSHIVSDLEKLCDYIALLHHGKLLLVEEKDVLKESYGLFRGSAEELNALPKNAICGTRCGTYQADALVRRDLAPGTVLEPVGIEDIFLYLVKGERV